MGVLARHLYRVSHDLRAPLRWISGFAQALEEGYASKLDAEGQRLIEKIRASTKDMGELLDGLAEVARFSRTELRRESVDLTAIVRQIASELQRDAPERQVEFVIAGGISANGDPRLLQRVLENLLNNAHKFTAKRVPARIEFGTTKTDGRTT